MKKSIKIVIVLIYFSSIGCSKKDDNETINYINNNSVNNVGSNNFQSGTYTRGQQNLIQANPSSSILSGHGYYTTLNISGSNATFYFDNLNLSTTSISGSINGVSVTLNSYNSTNQITGSMYSILNPSLILLTDTTFQYNYTIRSKTSSGEVVAENTWRVTYQKQ